MDYSNSTPEYIGYPHTPYFTWSPSIAPHSETLDFVPDFLGKEIIVQEKLDGEFTAFTRDWIAARSPDSLHTLETLGNDPLVHLRNQRNRDWTTFHWYVPQGITIYAENLESRHSCVYIRPFNTFHQPVSLFVFGARYGNTCLSHAEVLALTQQINTSAGGDYLMGVPVIRQRKFSFESDMMKLALSIIDEKKSYLDGFNSNGVVGGDLEGIVVRNINSFPMPSKDQTFSDIAKVVRPNHVQGTHWRKQKMIKNL